ncbi:MAG: helix-turn-helix domain-containing protein [Elusimicrobia bacterium]|nr:helix-turn-helix domain-containing protein [Candidatus Liberimonas magnetica]
MNTEILDVKEIAKYLKFSTKKVYKLLKNNEIPFKKIGGQYRFVKSEIDRWISQYLTAPQNQSNNSTLSEQTDIQKLLLKAGKIKDKLKKHLFITAILTKELEKYELKPVIVGGFAVEFYTVGGYSTGDIDLVFSDNKLLDKVLKGFGFTREGRHWINKELDVYIEAPGSRLTKGESEHLLEIEIEGLKAYILGVEDLIIDRLNAYVHWNSTDEANWVKELILISYDKIDWDYINKRSKEEKTDLALSRLKAEIIK